MKSCAHSVGVEVFGAEQGDQIFVALRIVAVREVLSEVFVRAFFGVVHVARIPLVLGGGNGVDAPVDEDAELRVLVPLRLLVLDERGPVGTIGAVVRLPVGFGERRLRSASYLLDRLLPFAIDLLGGLDVLGGRERIGILRRSLGEEKRKGNSKELQAEENGRFSYAGIVIDWGEAANAFISPSPIPGHLRFAIERARKSNSLPKSFRRQVKRIAPCVPILARY